VATTKIRELNRKEKGNMFLVYRKSDGLFIHPVSQHSVGRYKWDFGIEGACLYWYEDAKQVSDEIEGTKVISLELAKTRFPF